MINMFEMNYSGILKIGLKPSLDGFKRIISLDEFHPRVGNHRSIDGVGQRTR